MTREEVMTLMNNMSWEEMKEKIFVKAINAEMHKNVLKNCVFKRNGDIALVVCIMLDKYNNVTLPYTRVVELNLDSEAVYNAAMKNSLKIITPVMKSFKDIFTDHPGDLIMTPGVIPDSRRYCEYATEIVGILTTSEVNSCSASVIFYPEVAKKICCIFNTDRLYISFTSNMECIVHAANEDPDQEKILLDVLRSTTSECTSEDQMLTENLYTYNFDTNTISMIIS